MEQMEMKIEQQSNREAARILLSYCAAELLH